MSHKPGSVRFDLDRFLAAQEGVYPVVVSELTAGRKRTHWMWFIFPQIAGLGHSEMARFYAIATRAEAEAYAAHPILGARLRECSQLVLNAADRDITDILGTPDDLKFRSCMTLFGKCTPDNRVFLAALDKYFKGEADARTLELLRSQDSKNL